MTAALPTLFATCAPGLEPALERDLAALGLQGLRRVAGGVEFEGTEEHLWVANLGSRVASRVLLRVGTFRARGRTELTRKAAKLPWDRYLGPGHGFTVRATSRRSRLYHTGLLAEALTEAIEATTRATTARGSEPSTIILLRGERDTFTVSVDTSGELLHRRGYRTHVTEAPLRETLAAGLLILGGWDPSVPLLDPMCGSGTIPIEAALLSEARWPGLGRSFAFQGWPSFDQGAFHGWLEALPHPTGHPGARISGSDLDETAVEVARRNAARARVTVDFEVADFLELSPPSGQPGLVATNLPYGKRLSAGQLYGRIGQVLRARFQNWRVALLGPRSRSMRSFRLRWDRVTPLVNGGLKVALYEAKIG